jgi:hypothetical protein
MAGMGVVGLMITQLSFATPAIPETRIKDVVAFIANQAGNSHKTVLVPSDFEGSTIAEFAIQDEGRRHFNLVRPGKRLSSADWFGGRYSSRFASADEMMRDLAQNPVDLAIRTVGSQTKTRPHERLLDQVLDQYPNSWSRLVRFGPTAGSALSWEVYQYQKSGSEPRE